MAFSHSPISCAVNITLKPGGCDIYTNDNILNYIKHFYAIFSLSKYSGNIKFSYEFDKGKVEPKWTPQILQYTKIGSIMREIDDTLKESLNKVSAFEIATNILDQIKGLEFVPKSLSAKKSDVIGIYWSMGRVMDNKTSSSYNLTDVEILTNSWKKDKDNRVIPFKDGELRLLEDIQLTNNLFSKSKVNHPLNKLKEIYSAYFAVRYLFEKDIKFDVGLIDIHAPVKPITLDKKNVSFDIVIGKDQSIICIGNEWYSASIDTTGETKFEIVTRPTNANIWLKYNHNYYCVNGGVICHPKEVTHVTAPQSAAKMPSKKNTYISDLETTNFLISSMRSIHRVNYLSTFFTVSRKIIGEENKTDRKRSDVERILRVITSFAGTAASVARYSAVGTTASAGLLYTELYEKGNRGTLKYAEEVAEKIRKLDGNKEKLEELARDIIFNNTVSVADLP